MQLSSIKCLMLLTASDFVPLIVAYVIEGIHLVCIQSWQGELRDAIGKLRSYKLIKENLKEKCI